jgi:UDP-hydrolysing UDP-N-acetyl-D-glucosamine 2-epimerase
LSEGYLVVMQHPVTTEYRDSRKHIEVTLAAIHKLNKPTLWFWPNVDAGADGTSTGIRAFREQHQLPNVHFFKNMEGIDFLQLLQHSDCLIGNSSVGIRECAYLGVPVVNIGSRQNRRDRGGNSVDVDYCQEKIQEAILSAMQKGKSVSSSLYGDGKAGRQIAELLATSPLQFHKTIMY